ncbi:alkylhydroperoxidase, partial [Rhizobium ruizarguesonis]
RGNAPVGADRRLDGEKETRLFIEAVFADGLEATLEEHLQEIFNFSARLSTTPPEAVAAEAQSLADVGLDKLEALDLVLYSA